MADAKKVALYALTSGLVLDRLVFTSLPSAEIEATITQIRESELPLLVVNGANGFFTSDNMLALIKAGNDDYKLIAEHTKITVTDEDVAAIRRVEAIIEALKPPIPPYDFAAVPQGWSVKTDLNIGPTFVQRRRNNIQGDGVTYKISLPQLKRIWLVAVKYWAKVPHTPYIISDVKAAGYLKAAGVSDDKVVIGCQTVRRYELEQLALSQDWDFPELAKK